MTEMHIPLYYTSFKILSLETDEIGLGHVWEKNVWPFAECAQLFDF